MSKDMPKFDPEKDKEWRKRLTNLSIMSRGVRTETGIYNMENRKATMFVSAVPLCYLLRNEIFLQMRLASISFGTPRGVSKEIVDKSYGMTVEVRCGCVAHTRDMC